MSLGGPSAPDRGKSSASAIDRSVLGEWLADDDVAINELLGVFRDSIRAEQVKLLDSLAAGDLAEFASAAHRLRGAALSMGARALADVAGELYSAAKAGNASGCAGGMAELDTQVRRMVAEVPGGAAP